MKKTFIMQNDIGLEVKYTILAKIALDKDYVVYTNYLPSDNELGIRLFVGIVESMDPVKIKKATKKEEKEILDDFKMQVLQTPIKK